MRLAIVVTAIGLMVASCGSSDQKATAAKPEIAPLKIGEVSLNGPVRALGTEPFWSVDLAASGITFSRIDQQPVTGASVEPKVTGNMAVWETTLPDQRLLSVTMTGTDCSDGMSDRVYPLAALVKIGEETLQGCAATLEALERASESGRVE